jgi:hypothetical protein
MIGKVISCEVVKVQGVGELRSNAAFKMADIAYTDDRKMMTMDTQPFAAAQRR